MAKEDFIDTYVINTLNEIKEIVKNKINLGKEQEEKTDEKMSRVLKELIESNFKNLSVDGAGNLIYTLLPLTDEKENNKIRRTLVLYYTALYFDNVALLNRMLQEEVDFGYQLWELNLSFLDKSITSNFDEDEYIEVVKDCGNLFVPFNSTTKNLPSEERKDYITRFVSIIKMRHKDLKTTVNNRHDFYSLFTKDSLDIYEDESYLKASKSQLKMMSSSIDGVERIKNEDTIRRLNNLIQTTDFNHRYYQRTDLMFSLFSDEELFDKDYFASIFFGAFCQTSEMLEKAKDLYARNPGFARVFNITSIFEIDNDILIELYDDIMKGYSAEHIKLKAKFMKPKVMVKRIFKRQ